MGVNSVLFYMKEHSLPLEDASLPLGRFFKQPKAWEASRPNNSSLIPSETHTHRLAHHIIQPPPPRGRRWTALISARFITLSPVGSGEAQVHPVPPTMLEDTLRSWAGYWNPSWLPQHCLPLTAPLPKALLPHSTHFSTDTNSPRSSWAGEYGAVDMGFLGGGKSRRNRLAWELTGRKENKWMHWRQQS